MMIETNSPEETYAFGKKLGMEAQAGQVYCLNGDLGVGKTVFTQGFAAGLGIQEPVNSPTFTIVQEYDDGRLPMEFRNRSTARLSRSCRSTTMGACRSTILMYIVSAMWTRWMRLAMRTISTARASA